MYAVLRQWLRRNRMLRRVAILFVGFMACGQAGGASAQPISAGPAGEVASLLQQNRLVEEVSRDDPADLWSLVRKIGILVTNPRDSGAARTAARPTAAEVSQIADNPALQLAYARDPAATLALLRATNEELRQARLNAGQDRPRRVALVIGSSGDAVWGKLATTQNDATLVAATLARQGFEISGGGAVIDPDKPHLLQAIGAFIHAIGPGTIALFYYAGHGVQDNGRNFIVPAGAAIPQAERDYDRSLVGVDSIVLGRMQQANASLSILVLDACRDHPSLLARGAASSAAPGSLPRGLAAMGASSSRGDAVVIYSTSPNDIARDSVGGEPDTPFASAFAAAVGQGGLEIRDVFDKVANSVDQATHHEQQPWISYSTTAKFYFNPASPLKVFAAGMPLSALPLCPKPGTPVTLVEAGQAIRGSYQAINHADPALCGIVTAAGESRTLLFNLYDTDRILDPAPAEAALGDLLSGRANKVNFDVRSNVSFPFATSSETWTRIGQADLLVDNRYVQTTIFDRERRGRNIASSGYGVGAFGQQRLRVWYNPGLGVVKENLAPAVGDGDDSAQSESRVISVAPF
jgi:hypothetical protein